MEPVSGGWMICFGEAGYRCPDHAANFRHESAVRRSTHCEDEARLAVSECGQGSGFVDTDVLGRLGKAHSLPQWIS